MSLSISSCTSTSAIPCPLHGEATIPISTNRRGGNHLPEEATSSGNNNHLPNETVSRSRNVGRGQGASRRSTVGSVHDMPFVSLPLIRLRSWQTPEVEPGNPPTEHCHAQQYDMRYSQITIVHGDSITITCREDHSPTHYETRKSSSNCLARFWAKAWSFICALFFGWIKNQYGCMYETISYLSGPSETNFTPLVVDPRWQGEEDRRVQVVVPACYIDKEFESQLVYLQSALSDPFN